MNRNEMTKEQRMIELLQEFDNDTLVILHNEYCQKINNFDDEIYTIDMFDEIMQGLDPFTLACRVAYGDFNGGYEYFKFNGYGNIQSICKYELYRYIDVVDIARYIIDNDDDFDINDILCILSDGDLEEPEYE